MKKNKEFSIKDWDDFFEEIKRFKEKQNRQKQRGLNDYNMVYVQININAIIIKL